MTYETTWMFILLTIFNCHGGIFAIEFIGVLRILNNFAVDSIKKCVDDYLNYLKSRGNRRQHAPVAGLALMITE